MQSASAPTFSSASLRCASAIRSHLVQSSRDIGWTSVLVDHHRIDADEDPFETLPTPDQTIVVMTRGEQRIASFRCGAWREAVYRVGTVGLTAGGLSDRLRRRRSRNAQPFEKVNLYVPEEFFVEAAEHFRGIGTQRVERVRSALAFDDRLLGETVLALLEAMRRNVPDFYAEAAMQWLATHMLTMGGKWFDERDDRRHCGLIDDHRLARVLEFMSARFADVLTLDDFAAEAGVSKFHFARLFKERTGLSPYAMLVEIRLDSSKRMLRTTDLAVATVAMRCGFASPTHFSTLFRKRLGLSPTAFRAIAR